MAAFNTTDAGNKTLKDAAKPEHALSEGTASVQSEAQTLLQQQRPAARIADSQGAKSLDAGSMQSLYGADSVAKGELNHSRHQLLETAHRVFENHEQETRFKDNMESFEKRMGSSARAEIQRTYAEVQRLLDNPSSIVAPEVKQNIAQDILERAAHPTQSNQGLSLDCGAAAIENRLYSRTPSAAAHLTTEATLSGQFRDAQGRVVTLDHQSIAVHQATNDPANTGLEARSHGDQIMQMIVRNEELAEVNSKAGISSECNHGLKYQLNFNGNDVSDTEKVIDYSTNPARNVSQDFGGMDTNSFDSVYRNLSMKSDNSNQNFFIDDFQNTGPNTENFKRTLESMQGKFPIVIGINTDQEPFRTDMNMAGVQSQEHAITVEKYDADTGMIHYRNSNFGSREFTLSADQMYRATLLHRDDTRMWIAASQYARSDKENDPSYRTQFQDVYGQLQRTSPEQRQEFYDRFKKEKNIDIHQHITPQQMRDLGIIE